MAVLLSRVTAGARGLGSAAVLAVIPRDPAGRRPIPPRFNHRRGPMIRIPLRARLAILAVVPARRGGGPARPPAPPPPHPPRPFNPPRGPRTRSPPRAGLAILALLLAGRAALAAQEPSAHIFQYPLRLVDLAIESSPSFGVTPEEPTSAL